MANTHRGDTPEKSDEVQDGLLHINELPPPTDNSHEVHRPLVERTMLSIEKQTTSALSAVMHPLVSVSRQFNKKVGSLLTYLLAPKKRSKKSANTPL